ncbi:MAG: GlcNAc-PI de-N-acetylase, partial [Calditrichaeota bacterium]
HCRMEPQWERFDFAVDVSDVYPIKQRAVAAYESVFSGEQQKLLRRFEAEDQHIGRLVGVRYAEIFRSRAPLVVDDLTVFKSVRYG